MMMMMVVGSAVLASLGGVIVEWKAAITLSVIVFASSFITMNVHLLPLHLD